MQNLWPGCGFSLLNTHLLLLPTMESVNLGHRPNAIVRTLLFFTKLSKLFCKESFLPVCNSDFHCTTETSSSSPPPRPSLFKEIPHFYPSKVVHSKLATRLCGGTPPCKGFCALQLVVVRHQKNRKYL